jgi:hypothetical protein
MSTTHTNTSTDSTQRRTDTGVPIDADYLSDSRPDAESTIRPDPDAGDAISLSRRPGDGATEKEGCTQDSDSTGAFPDDVPDEKYTPAGSTLYAKDARRWYDRDPDTTRRHVGNDRTERQRWKEMWLMNHGLKSWGTEDRDHEAKEKGYQLDTDLRDRFMVCLAVTSTLPLTDDTRDRAVRLGATGVGGDRTWNFRLAGSVGLCLAHAIRLTFDGPTSARDSPLWGDFDRICQNIDIDTDELLSRAFDIDPADDETTPTGVISGPSPGTFGPEMPENGCLETPEITQQRRI